MGGPGHDGVFVPGGVPVLVGSRADGTADPEVAERAARTWLAGGLVGLPTETVYGLAADAADPVAVRRIYAAKGRPTDHPLIVHVVGIDALADWTSTPNPAAHALAEAFWPGPLTVVLARGDRAGDHVTGGQGTVALRAPGHALAHACLVALARASGDPARGVAAPSANRFGRVSPTSAADVVTELGGVLDPRRDVVVDGGRCPVGVESTIVDCTSDPPRVLRVGAISQAQVDEVLAGRTRPLATEQPRGASGAGASAARAGAVTAGAGAVPSNEVRAPGTLESHYAPRARVILMEQEHLGSHAQTRPESALAAVPRPPGTVGLIAPAAVATPAAWRRLAEPASAIEYAHGLYAALRAVDDAGLDLVVVVLPRPTEGPLAAAVRDRLTRAAHLR